MSEQPPPYPGSDWVAPGAGAPGAPPPPPEVQAGYGYPAPPPAYYPGGPTQQPEPSKTMAIIALVLAIIPCGITWIVALVLGIIVVSQSKSGKVGGRGMGIAAIVISVVWMVLAVIALAFGITDEVKKDNARDTGSGKIDVVDLRVGDCLVNRTDEGDLRTIEITPCASSHRGEVFAVFAVDAGAEPTQDEIIQLSSKGCLNRFKDFIGVRYGQSKLEFTYVYPTKELLDINDEAVCIVSLPKEAATTGTLEGSKR